MTCLGRRGQGRFRRGGGQHDGGCCRGCRAVDALQPRPAASSQQGAGCRVQGAEGGHSPQRCVLAGNGFEQPVTAPFEAQSGPLGGGIKSVVAEEILPPTGNWCTENMCF